MTLFWVLIIRKLSHIIIYNCVSNGCRHNRACNMQSLFRIVHLLWPWNAVWFIDKVYVEKVIRWWVYKVAVTSWLWSSCQWDKWSDAIWSQRNIFSAHSLHLFCPHTIRFVLTWTAFFSRIISVIVVDEIFPKKILDFAHQHLIHCSFQPNEKRQSRDNNELNAPNSLGIIAQRWLQSKACRQLKVHRRL